MFVLFFLFYSAHRPIKVCCSPGRIQVLFSMKYHEISWNILNHPDVPGNLWDPPQRLWFHSVANLAWLGGSFNGNVLLFLVWVMCRSLLLWFTSCCRSGCPFGCFTLPTTLWWRRQPRTCTCGTRMLSWQTWVIGWPLCPATESSVSKI